MKRFKDDPDSTTPSLTVDTEDRTESQYNEWKKTGKIEGQNTDFPNRNNSLSQTFTDRLKKEKKNKKFDMDNLIRGRRIPDNDSDGKNEK